RPFARPFAGGAGGRSPPVPPFPPAAPCAAEPARPISSLSAGTRPRPFREPALAACSCAAGGTGVVGDELCELCRSAFARAFSSCRAARVAFLREGGDRTAASTASCGCATTGHG